MTDDLDTRLSELLAAATKGPWRRRGSGSPHVDIVSEAAGDDSPLVTLHEAGATGDLAHRRAETIANAELIIAAKTALPTLLADRKAASERIEELVWALNAAHVAMACAIAFCGRGPRPDKIGEPAPAKNWAEMCREISAELVKADTAARAALQGTKP